ncbi:MAG: NAD(P)/FAD-dependent oxidoreductase [Acidobacteria bacterium]|nr:NAD(P)/FAD-dependent oxidoreductase [Acidobacteriota bacterium]
MSGKTIIVLGGGVGGLVAANELRRRVGREHRIVVIEKETKHAFAPSFLWILTGDRRPEQVRRPLAQLVRPGVEVMSAEVRSIDPARRRVETSAQTLSCDYLIIALGAELAPESIPGLREPAYTFYSYEGVVRLRDALRGFTAGKVAVVVASMPYKCPGAPPEGAMLIADVLRKRGRRDKVEVHLFTPESQPMPVAGPELGSALQSMIEARGVAFHPLHRLARVDPDGQMLHFEGKEPVKYDLLVVVPPHRAPGLLADSGLTNEAGWVSVDRATLVTKYEGVYAIGDVTAVPIPGRWKPEVPLMLPKAGVFAHAQAEVVARRIADEIAGREPEDAFCGDGYCMLEAGEDLAGFAYGNFFAEPTPQVHLRKMGMIWHLGKVLFEHWWLAPFGFRRELLRLMLKSGARALRIPVVL